MLAPGCSLDAIPVNMKGVKCVYTDNNMTITEEGSTLLDDCPPVITIT